MRGIRRTSRSVGRAAPAALLTGLLAAFLALGLVGPLSAADAAPAHHGARHGHAHHVSALIAPAPSAGADRHVAPDALAPAGAHVLAAATIGTAGAVTASAASVEGRGSSARGPPATVDA
jgi:hypothetical protein